jgi:hypothetical protein
VPFPESGTPLHVGEEEGVGATGKVRHGDLLPAASRRHDHAASTGRHSRDALREMP